MPSLDITQDSLEPCKDLRQLPYLEVELQERLTVDLVALGPDGLPAPETVQEAWRAARETIAEAISEFRFRYLDVYAPPPSPWDNAPNPWADALSPCIRWWSEARFDFSCFFEWQRIDDSHVITFEVRGDRQDMAA